MSLKHILLGILQQPKSGYDIKKMFDEVFNNFWAAELSQIYPQLKKLTEADMLTVHESPSDKGPNKKIYQTTQQGKQELVSWLESGPVMHTEKLAYLAQTYFLASLDDDHQRLKFLEKLHQHMSTWHQTLVAIQNDMKQHFPDYPSGLPDEDFFPNLTLMLGVKKVGAKAEWAQDCIKLLKERMEKQ